ncbi:MAG: glycosyltransferase family 39 protein [Candidatus Solibacter sp.]
MFASSLLLIWLIQSQASASHAAFGGFPDEPAHYVAGLLIHDYVPHLFGQSPIRFVQDYYARVPYFALGVWPPLFYCIEGLWMLLFGVQRSSALWLVTASAAAAATFLYAALKQKFGPWTGAAGAALFLLTPAVQWSACMVMADLTCSLFAFVTVLFFVRYYDTQKPWDAILMGVFGGLSLLTKNSTYFVLLVPPLVILGTGSWSLIRKPALWFGGALPILIYAPWLYISRSVLLLGIHGLELPGFWGIQRHFARTLWEQNSFLFPLAAAGGVGVLLVMLRSGRKTMDGLTASMIAILPACSISIFLAKVPVQARLLTLPYMAIVFLTAQLLLILLRHRNRQAIAMALALGVFAAQNWMNFRFPPVNDIHAAVVFVQQRDGKTPGSVLTPSAREGAWIAEFAQTEASRPNRILVRPTKILGKEDWNGSDWQPFYRSQEELEAFMERMPVKYCVVYRAPRRNYPHDQWLRSMVAGRPAWWRPVYRNAAAVEYLSYDVYENTRWVADSERLVYQETDRIVPKVLKASR